MFYISRLPKMLYNKNMYSDLFENQNNLELLNNNHFIIIEPYKWNYIIWCNYCGKGEVFDGCVLIRK